MSSPLREGKQGGSYLKFEASLDYKGSPNSKANHKLNTCIEFYKVCGCATRRNSGYSLVYVR